MRQAVGHCSNQSIWWYKWRRRPFWSVDNANSIRLSKQKGRIANKLNINKLKIQDKLYMPWQILNNDQYKLNSPYFMKYNTIAIMHLFFSQWKRVNTWSLEFFDHVLQKHQVPHSPEQMQNFQKCHLEIPLCLNPLARDINFSQKLILILQKKGRNHQF